MIEYVSFFGVYYLEHTLFRKLPQKKHIKDQKITKKVTYFKAWP